jgi:serine/threonine protein kinase
MAIPGVQAHHLGRYELLARLASGGMGEIFLARLEGAAGFEKLYVVKRILPHLADDARFRQMLIAEARIASKMSHANICQVYELGETDGQLYIVMEYLEGITMLPLLRKASKEQTPLDLGFVAGVIVQTCDALHYAHDLKDRSGEGLGIVHRDVTPSNVFLTDSGIAKVLDFGIAKAKGASANTQTGTVKGKYAYMAPEQLRGASIDHRVDIFALGVVVYEMLALRRLFQRKTDYLTFRAVMEQPIPDIRRYRPDIPDKLADALGRALERDPGARYDTARQFGTTVIDALEGKRPWTQGELGDFVRANFADDIGKRTHQIASVIHRTGAGDSTRSTMPLIAHDDAPPDDEDDDDGFPSVETEVEAAPGFVPSPAPARSGASGDFLGGTPPPFSSETTSSAPSLQPLRGSPVIAPAPHTMVIARPRSIVWPLLATMMVLITGGALFLVWRQMQEQKPQELKIYAESGNGNVPALIKPEGSASSGSDEAHATDTGSDTGSDHVVDPPKGSGSATVVIKPRSKQFTSYDAAIASRRPSVQQCLRDHNDGSVPSELHAVISIAPSGKAKTVSLKPATLNSTPLGMCIKNALLVPWFPGASVEQKIDVPFYAKTT